MEQLHLLCMANGAGNTDNMAGSQKTNFKVLTHSKV